MRPAGMVTVLAGLVALVTEGLAVHTPDELRAVASAFVGWNWVRIGGCVVGAVAASVACVRFHDGHVRGRLAQS